MQLHLKDFSYEIPEELVAQTPLPNRAESRLLVRGSSGEVIHSRFAELRRFLPPGTLLVYNDSRVIPGRILCQSPHGGKLEIMLLRPLDPDVNSWLALGKPFRKFKCGSSIKLDSNLELFIEKINDADTQVSLEIRFSLPYQETLNWLEINGYIPLPPYILRKSPLPAKESSDKQRYQTVYAQNPGSVAAPTAGLHFTAGLWEELKEYGIIPVPLTLHVGGGTFLPVKKQNIDEHIMHSEYYRMPMNSWEKLVQAEKNGSPIVCVGTTALRCLESFARKVQDQAVIEDILDRWQETNLFIYPETSSTIIKPWGIQALITNFHQPESSLLMLVSALIGYDETRRLYQTAIEQKYRFYSYGDASLLWLR